MAPQDNLMYFGIRARAEATRMLYVLAGVNFVDERLGFSEWPAKKPDTPIGQIPVLTTEYGTLIQSTSIARYVAKKFGMVGRGLWDESLNDVIVETMQEVMNVLIAKVTPWKALKMVPEPADSKKLLNDIRCDLQKKLEFVKSISDKKGKRFLLGDEILLADVWLYTALELASEAFPDAMEINPWVKNFTSSFASDPRIKKYLAGRPAAPM